MNGVIFIGLQASGKSSFYLRQFYNTHLRLNLDMLKTRHREGILFNACLTSKQPVVIDNTNPTKKDREKYVVGFKSHRFELVGFYFVSSLEDCIKRNSLREGKACIPEAGLRGTYNKLERPQYSEGFDRLYRVAIKGDGFAVEDWDESF